MLFRFSDTQWTTLELNTVHYFSSHSEELIPTQPLPVLSPAWRCTLFLLCFLVVIVGHTECGGAAACLGAAQNPGLDLSKPIATVPSLPADASLNRWLEPLTRHTASLGLSSAPHAEALPVVVEENVRVQVENLAKTVTITEAWTKGSRKGQDVYIHGWVYDISTGILKDLNVTRGPPGKLPASEP